MSACPPGPDDPEDPDAVPADRPTLVPEFDVEAFARDSEVRQRVARPVAPGGSTIETARALYDDGQTEEALFMLARLLELVPLDAEARALSAECSLALEKECLTAVGSRSAVLHIGVPDDMLRDSGMDHVSGFLVSRIDGKTDVEGLLDSCGLPRLLALRHLRGLVTSGIVIPKRRGIAK